MSKKRILLMYISKNSGHHHASAAVESALHELSDDVETRNVNSFCYTNPILEKIINRTYMSIIKRKPEVWGYLYDNPRVVEKTQKLRNLFHKYTSNKMRALLEEFKPHAVICTQAFPCGIVADLKKTHGTKLLLSGILTDYAPHAYWLYDAVDLYFVPSEETKEKLVLNGIANDRIKLTGIPVDLKFNKIIDRGKIMQNLNLSKDIPTVLVMGGSQGFGPIKEVAAILDNSLVKLQIIIVTGVNKKLYRYFKRRTPRFNKKTLVFGYIENIDELMGIASIIIGKPGGITISEALSKGIPVIIVKPIPGHEQMNTEYLIKHKVAIKVDRLPDIDVIVRELLSNPVALENLKEHIKKFARPSSAMDIAKTVLERIM